VLKTFFGWMFENEGIKHTFEKFYNLGATMKWFFKLMRTFMMFIQAGKIKNFLKEHESLHKGILDIHYFQIEQKKAFERLE